MPSEMDSVHAHLDWCPICQELVNAAAHHFEHPPEGIDAPRDWANNFRGGQLIAGRYEVERFLGRGGMGEVYCAFDRVLLERVALKTVLSTTSDNPHAGRRLFSEARLARRISHPNVCRVHDVGVHEEPGRPDEKLHFLTMELIEGHRLGKLLRSGPLDLWSVHRIARQILLGLAAAHRAGVLHRDLKSDNVMVTGYPLEPRVAITDFGLSRALDSRSRALGTLGHERVGSVAYMAPEQLLGQELGPESDVFGFGVVLYEMLCGSLPFPLEGADSAELVSGRLRQRAPTPSALRPGVSGQLDALVLSCLNPAPRSRHRRTIDVLAMLDRVNEAGAFRPPPFSALRAHLRQPSPRVS